jgi:hypothetical protein
MNYNEQMQACRDEVEKIPFMFDVHCSEWDPENIRFEVYVPFELEKEINDLTDVMKNILKAADAAGEPAYYTELENMTFRSDGIGEDLNCVNACMIALGMTYACENMFDVDVDKATMTPDEMILKVLEINPHWVNNKDIRTWG